MGYSELNRPTCWENNVQPQRARPPQSLNLIHCSDSSPTPGPFGQFAGPRSAGSPSKSPEKMTTDPSTSPVRWPVAVLHGAVLAAGAVPLVTVSVSASRRPPSIIPPSVAPPILSFLLHLHSHHPILFNVASARFLKPPSWCDSSCTSRIRVVAGLDRPLLFFCLVFAFDC